MNSERIVSIHGSPRGRGNSATLAAHVEADAREAGAEVVPFFVHGMSILPCAACDECRGSLDA